MHEWMNKWKNERTDGGLDEWMIERLPRRMNYSTNKRMNKWTNEQTNRWIDE